MRGCGAIFEPDPCGERCIFQTFGEEAQLWMQIFRQCVKTWKDQKTKSTKFEIDFSAVKFVFEAYGVSSHREGLEMLYTVMDQWNTSNMTDEQILGLEEF